jgi:hypothetical protein
VRQCDIGAEEVTAGKIGRDDAKAPVAKASWIQASTVMIAGMQGIHALS